MNSNLLRNLSFNARRLRVSATPSLFSLTAPTSFCSHSHSSGKPKPIVEDISNEGKPIDADDELMREILGKGTWSEDDEEDEFDSNWDTTDDIENEDKNLEMVFKGRTRVDERKN